MMVGEIEVKERPRPSPDYLMQLLNEKKLMTSLPNLCGIFTHLERLLDEDDPKRKDSTVQRKTEQREQHEGDHVSVAGSYSQHGNYKNEEPQHLGWCEDLLPVGMCVCLH
ncbi:protein quaking-A-like isoform X1 [Tachysurus ichikawai]